LTLKKDLKPVSCLLGFFQLRKLSSGKIPGLLYPFLLAGRCVGKTSINLLRSSIPILANSSLSLGHLEKSNILKYFKGSSLKLENL